jgi:thiol-disulfide isomerase/thioredoxin
MTVKLRLVLVAALAAATLAALPADAPAGPMRPTMVRDIPVGDLKKAITAYKGKVVLVNLWATWCKPCVAEFPNLVKLHTTYGSKGLVVLAVSLDEPEDRSRVIEFVASQRALFPVVLRRDGDRAGFIRPLDPKWDGAVPMTYVFDKKGSRVGRPILGARTYAQLESLVKPLLK